ncbi:MAG: TIGR03086 family metal-binding protein [Acidimicrobiales bacterium]
MSETAPLDALTRSSATFGEQLALVGDEDWARQTNTENWDVRSLVAHLVIGDATAKDALSGVVTKRVTSFDAAILGEEPLVAWRGTAVAMIRAFSDPGVLEEVYELDGVSLSGEALLGLRVSDALVHTWDLAEAIGRSIALPDDLAEFALDSWSSLMSRLDDATFYGEGPIEPAVDAAPAVRLLALMGRRG